MEPWWEIVSNPFLGETGTRPNDGFRPTTPQKRAGIRIDPAPSLPSASGAMPAATAAAAPPLEPPETRSTFQGLLVVPNSGLSQTPLLPNSGVVVFPTRMAPAPRSRSTRTASSVGTCSANARDPNVV